MRVKAALVQAGPARANEVNVGQAGEEITYADWNGWTWTNGQEHGAALT